MSFRETYRKFWRRQQEARRFRMSDERHVCKNCGREFTGNYCPCCGQRHSVGPVTWDSIREGIMDLWGVGTRSMPFTIWQLLTRPGYLIGDYISGRRQVSFPPVKMLVFTAMIIYILDHLLGLNVFGSTDSSETAKTAETVATSSSTIIDRFFAWFESHYDWSVLLIFSLLILPTWIVFRRAPRQTGHSLPQGFFVQVFNSVLFLVLVFLFSILKFPLMLGNASDDLLMCVSLVIFGGQVVVVYRQLFGYSLRGTLWRMLPLLGLTIIELTILAVIASLIVGAADNDHKPWVYVVFGIVFIALVAISFKIFAVVFTKRPAQTAGQRRWQKVVMGLLWFGFIVNTAVLLRIAYVDITGNYSKDTTLDDTTLTFMSTAFTIISAALWALQIYMIRRLRRKMRKPQQES